MDVDIKRSLELYYSFEGTSVDLASNETYQNGSQELIYYDNSLPGAMPIQGITVFAEEPGLPPNYRPDQPHLILTSPSVGSGVKNKLNDNTEIR